MHVLFCGVTESGKTTLARAVARDLHASGQNVIIYDPVGTNTAGGGWPVGEGAILFSDFGEFAEYVSRDDVRGAHLFIDEAGDHFGVGNKENHWLLTRGRHFFLYVYLIAQRPKMLAPTARTQCSRTYAFRMAPEDMREVFADNGHAPPEKNQKPLDQGDFYVLLSGNAKISRANVFKLLSGEKP